MKKLISILMALMIAMFAVSAVAESAPEAYAGELTINVSEEGVNALMAMSGSGVEIPADSLSAVVSLINNVSLKGVIVDKEGQLDIMLKGESIVSLAGKKEKGGALYIFSDLVPNSYITVADETIKQLMEQTTQSVQQSIQGIDPEALAAAVMPHLQKAGEEALSKMGETETVSYSYRGAEFTAKTPINMTTKEIAVLGLTLIKDILSEETMAPVVSQMEGFNLSDIDEALKEVQEKSDDELPATEMALYSNEDGAVLFDINMSKDGQTVAVQTAVIGEKLIIYADMLSQAVIDIEADMETGSVNMDFTFSSNGMKINMNIALQATETGVTGDLSLSLNDSRVITFSGRLEKGGEITASFDTEGKTETKFETLMGGDSSAMGPLMNDFQSNIMGVLMKAMQIMPDEIGALTGGSN